ncbi:MAG: response regulator, partial [Myxococcales bacterium]|nr:response regulator [Myxococcales bacterium]
MPNVLIVEDEGLVAHDLELSLRKLGYDVAGIAATADEALQEAASRRPDLVLMDIRLRGERDGIEAGAALRDAYGIPVVYLTAHADDATLDRAKRTEPAGYLVKPWNPLDLRSTLEVAMYRSEMETRLRDGERWMRTLLASIDDAVVAVATDCSVTYMNPGAERLAGVAADEARGRALADVLPLVATDTETPIADPARRAMDERRSVRLPPGTRLRERIIEDSASPIVGANGDLLGAVLVCRDTSEERRIEEELARSDRLRALGALAAGVGHEINNPLTFVAGNLALALEELRALALTPSLPAAARARIAILVQSLADAEQGTERIQQITTDLRTFARPLGETLVPTDVAECAAWALRVTARETESRARVTAALAPTPLVLASEARIGQVLVNLLVNAAQAIADDAPDANEIHVETESDERGWAVLRVRDTGSGIPPEIRALIFEPFFSTKPERGGSGIGLAVSQNIVERLGGEIRVESEPGRGSVFEVSLPPAPGSAPREPR